MYLALKNRYCLYFALQNPQEINKIEMKYKDSKIYCDGLLPYKTSDGLLPYKDSITHSWLLQLTPG